MKPIEPEANDTREEPEQESGSNQAVFQEQEEKSTDECSEGSPASFDAVDAKAQFTFDEVAAAEAELKAAQEKLTAAKAKMAQNQQTADEPGAGEETPVAENSTTLSAQSPCVNPVVVPTSSQAAQPAQPPLYTQPEYQSPQYSYAQPHYAQTQQPVYQSTPQSQSAQQPSQPQQPPQQTSYAYQQPYYQQPYYQQPFSQPAMSSKDHVAAGLLALFLGMFGIHKFYLGYNNAGFIMLAVSSVGGVLSIGIASTVVWIIAVIEGIMYLSKSQSDFEQIYVLRKNEWF